MGVYLQRTSYETSNKIANELKEPISKVQLVIETYQKRILLYLKNGETVPLYQLATLSVVRKTTVYTRGHNQFTSTVKGNLNITMKMLISEVSEILNFTKKSVHTIITTYHKNLLSRLDKGASVYISGIISIQMLTKEDGTLRVYSSVPTTLRKTIQDLGYENITVRTSEYLKDEVNKEVG